MASSSNVTAFVLDETISVGDEGATIPGVPGLWFHDRPVLASALEYSVQEMRDAIALLGLPLTEVKVAESKAHEDFPEPSNRMESGREVAGGGTTTADAPETVELLGADPYVLDATVEKALEAEQDGED